jgi:hypothetical protein
MTASRLLWHAKRASLGGKAASLRRSRVGVGGIRLSSSRGVFCLTDFVPLRALRVDRTRLQTRHVILAVLFFMTFIPFMSFM